MHPSDQDAVACLDGLLLQVEDLLAPATKRIKIKTIPQEHWENR